MVTAKYIHIFSIGNPSFANLFIDFINSFPSKEIKPDEHFFVVQLSNEWINNVHLYKNVVIEELGNSLIKKYIDRCDFLFVHNTTQNDKLYYLKKKNMRKIVWRSWGSDSYIFKVHPNIINILRFWHPRTSYNSLRDLYIYMMIKKLSKNIKCIGIANNCDAIDLNHIFTESKMMFLPYRFENFEIRRPTSYFPMITNGKIKILLGHNTYTEENHIKILKKLLSFKEANNCIIYIPLIIKHSNYIDEIVNFCKGKNNIIIIKKHISSSEYNWFLKKIDIAIFDSVHSNGLGNISRLLYLKKTLYLNADGIIARSFDADNIPYYTTDKIDRNIFDRANLLKYDASKSSLCEKSKEERTEMIIKLLKFINK